MSISVSISILIFTTTIPSTHTAHQSLVHIYCSCRCYHHRCRCHHTTAAAAIIAPAAAATITAAAAAAPPLPPLPLHHRCRRCRPLHAHHLWHIDGHHKLIKYKIVIHGGVDGKSRTVTFMQANSNNRAETVTTCFLAGVQRWGWPSRVRADHGGENLGVMQVMEQARGQGRGSFIQGPSTRNQRIERMWVDVQRWNTAKYKAMFETLEDDGILDVASPIHLWVLHVVFLPQLNRALQHFADVWNRHPIRTANHNWSPEQKHTAGVLDAERKGFDLRAQPAALEDEEAGEHLRQHAMRNFAEYGDDIPRRGRERRADDPHVVVEPVDRGVSALLLDLEVQSWIEAQVPLAWPPGEDLGIGSLRSPV
ncbi:hypothetical protein CF336_g4472 [Tilletia laevis]|nr:hypothetical protein CF336_g4472 [Tilletia laevis]